MKPYVGAVLATAVLLGCSVDSGGPVEGKQAPDFTVIDAMRVDHPKVSLADFKGKVVLVEFWATWCGPCRSIMPEVQRMHDDLAAKGLQVVAISDEALGDIQQFRRGSPFTYPVFQDIDLQANTRYKVQAIPTSFVVDRTGKIAFQEVGTDPQAVRKAIEGLL